MDDKHEQVVLLLMASWDGITTSLCTEWTVLEGRDMPLDSVTKTREMEAQVAISCLQSICELRVGG
jgi:hypothetical protein